jgi:hypothetical protein
MSDPGRFPVRLSARKLAAIAARARGASQREAAREAGMSERQLRRDESENPVFIATLKKVKDEVWTAGMCALRGLSVDAVAALKASLEPGTEPALRLRAAVAVLDLGVKVADEEIRARLDALEARIKGDDSR